MFVGRIGVDISRACNNVGPTGKDLICANRCIGLKACVADKLSTSQRATLQFRIAITVQAPTGWRIPHDVIQRRVSRPVIGNAEVLDVHLLTSVTAGEIDLDLIEYLACRRFPV